jgi:hypothetical protein
LLQGQPNRALHHALGAIIARQRPADEIVDAGIADVLLDGRIDLAQQHEIVGQRLCRSGIYDADDHDAGKTRDSRFSHQPPNSPT